MKKVLLVSNRVMHYRVSVYNAFTRRFRERGWELLVRADELQRENPHPPEFDFQVMPPRFAAYRREIEAIRPDAVILFLHLKDRLIWPLAHWLKLKGIPVIFWTKGLNLDAPGSLSNRLLYPYMHRLFDRLILYSAGEMGHIAPRLRHKVFVANNTINFDDFPAVTESPEAIKRQMGIPFRKVVLSVGRMGVAGGRKKIDHLIEVFRQVQDPDLGLVIVGSGVDREALDRSRLPNVIYLGEVHDPAQREISRIFRMADVFSIPGHVGLGLNQAFFWGLPVVTEEGGQPPEIHYLTPGRNGFIVPANDLQALKDRILHLLENDQVRREFSRNAREDILRLASVDRMFKGFHDCLESLTPPTPPREKGIR